MSSNPWETEFETDGAKYYFSLFKNKDAYYGGIFRVEDNHKIAGFSIKAVERKAYMEQEDKQNNFPEATLQFMEKGFKMLTGSEIPVEAQLAIRLVLENFFKVQKERTHKIPIPDRKLH